jgi:hypothetical protein
MQGRAFELKPIKPCDSMIPQARECYVHVCS